MIGRYIVRHALRRQALSQPCQVFSRSNSFGRPERSGPTSLLPSTPARTRFAPSPTGYVHTGSLRTALFNYLLAKATGGQFVVRIEDTDQTRLVPDAEEKIYEDLKWAGLSWDEGPDVGGPFGPYKQSLRLQLYKEHLDRLVENGRAYRCFCTVEDLDALKKLALQESRDPIYNKACSHIPAEESARRAENGEAHCVRFKSDNGSPCVHDLVYGAYKSPNLLDDFVIMKRDGFPTYHFANVVDDHLMKITHVIRGAEWLVSTPRHVALYDALGWQAPQFAHVGLLVDQNHQKLSKRKGNFNLSSWKEKGVLPIALLNHVLLLGWSPSREGNRTSEVMEMDEMIQNFHLRFTKGDVVVNNKFEFLQKVHLRRALNESEAQDSVFTSISPSLSAAITECEEIRVAQGHAAAAHQDLKVRIGPLLSKARSTESVDEPSAIVSQSYIKALFDLDGGSYTNTMDYLKRNVYFFWKIPREEHRKRVRVERAMLKRIAVSVMTGKSKEEKKWFPQKLSKLGTLLYKTLYYIPEEDWTDVGIKTAITPLIEKIGYRSEDGKVRPWGWKFLRFVAGAPTGPSMIPTMVFLGKEETLARAKQATFVAKRNRL